MIDRLHPLSLLIYFLFASMVPAFSGNPFLHVLCLITGFAMLFTWKDSVKILKQVPFYILFFVVVSLFNPFFYHNGNTVLFYMAGRRITLEALLFGADAALMVTGVLVWFESLSHYMTSDKVLLLFGKLSAKASTIITLVLRIIPHYRAYIKKYRKYQKLLGLYGDGSFLERVRAEGKIFTGFITWALEHSMTTADSMASRGYGVTRRRNFTLHRFRFFDGVLTAIALLSSSLLILAVSRGILTTEYYPAIVLPERTPFLIFSGSVYIISASFLTVFHLMHINRKVYNPGKSEL